MGGLVISEGPGLSVQEWSPHRLWKHKKGHFLIKYYQCISLERIEDTNVLISYGGRVQSDVPVISPPTPPPHSPFVGAKFLGDLAPLGYSYPLFRNFAFPLVQEFSFVNISPSNGSISIYKLKLNPKPNPNITLILDGLSMYKVSYPCKATNISS